MPLSDCVTRQNAILNRTLLQSQIGSKPGFRLRLHVVTHQTGCLGLCFQHRPTDGTA